MSKALSNVFKLNGVVNVKDPQFGAKGDGVTDDTAAIQAALNALGAAGGTVYFPVGQYLVSSTITTPVVVRLIGEGTCITAASDGATQIIKKSTMTTPVLVISTNRSSVEAIEFEGQGGNTGDGIQILAPRVCLRDVSVFSMGNDGIRIGSEAGAENCNLWSLQNVASKSNGRDGLRIDDTAAVAGSANCNAGTALHLDLQSNTGAGLYHANAQLNTFVGGAYQSNGTYGIFLSADSDYNAFFGGDPESNSTKDIFVTSGATGNQFFCPARASTAVTDNDTSTLTMMADQYKLGRGLQFPATQVASSNVNTLDDYEEGTWTPTYTTTGTDFDSVTYDALTGGTYVKIGKLVHIQGVLKTDAITVGSASGTVRIGGLPFTAVSSTGSTDSGSAAVAIGYASTFTGEEPIHGLVIAGTTKIALYYRTAVDGDSTATAIADMNTGADSNLMYFSGSYIASA